MVFKWRAVENMRKCNRQKFHFAVKFGQYVSFVYKFCLPCQFTMFSEFSNVQHDSTLEKKII